jgi:hypothetical protein
MNSCFRCSKQHDGKFGSGKFCSRSCANKRNFSVDTKSKISLSLTKWIPFKRICEECNIEFVVATPSQKLQRFCSRVCSRKHNHRLMSVSGGRQSVLAQGRRSKNEIYFAELCFNHFNSVETNEPKFNGWDADIIINDIKIAVLWNGKWHYEKITKAHSLLQVQNRDRIKIDEIKKFGYHPYIIVDMGKFSKKFVEEQFRKFIAGWGSVCP